MHRQHALWRQARRAREGHKRKKTRPPAALCGGAGALLHVRSYWKKTNKGKLLKARATAPRLLCLSLTRATAGCEGALPAR